MTENPNIVANGGWIRGEVGVKARALVFGILAIILAPVSFITVEQFIWPTTSAWEVFVDVMAAMSLLLNGAVLAVSLACCLKEKARTIPLRRRNPEFDLRNLH